MADSLPARRTAVRLTKRVVDAVPYPTRGQRFVRDQALRGFALRVTPSNKSFVVERRREGRLFRVTLGRYGHLTVEQARTEAMKVAGQLARGEDPLTAKQQRIQAYKDQQAEPTFGELADRYLTDYAGRKRSRHNDVSALANHLHEWRSRKLNSIVRSDVARLHATVGRAGHPYGANRLVSLLRVMFNLAHSWGMRAGENPATGIRRFAEHARERFLDPHELARLLKALQAEPDPYVQAIFLMLLLTGARKYEVLTARWDCIDLEYGVWHIPTTKVGRGHRLPLPAPLIEILRQLPRQHGNPAIFPGRGGLGVRSNIKGAWNRICKHAALRDVRIHDLRRTLGSWLSIAGESLTLVGKTLNHSQPSTTAIYARLNLDSIRLALDSNAKRMLSVAE